MYPFLNLSLVCQEFVMCSSKRLTRFFDERRYCTQECYGHHVGLSLG